jgi:hypothetical protein
MVKPSRLFQQPHDLWDQLKRASTAEKFSRLRQEVQRYILGGLPVTRAAHGRAVSALPCVLWEVRQQLAILIVV